jgi:hypothetical protein
VPVQLQQHQCTADFSFSAGPRTLLATRQHQQQEMKTKGGTSFSPTPFSPTMAGRQSPAPWVPHSKSMASHACLSRCATLPHLPPPPRQHGLGRCVTPSQRSFATNQRPQNAFTLTSQTETLTPPFSQQLAPESFTHYPTKSIDRKGIRARHATRLSVSSKLHIPQRTHGRSLHTAFRKAGLQRPPRPSISLASHLGAGCTVNATLQDT